MRKLKRAILLVMTAVMMLSLTSCGTTERFSVDSAIPSDRPALEINAAYEPYVIPWYKDAAAESAENKTLDFYFMSDVNAIRDHSEELGLTADYWGDSTLIFFPDGEVMLLDTGDADYAPVLVQNLKYLGVETIDYLVFSHPHSDHSFAAFAEGGIFDSFKITNVCCNGVLNQGWSDMDRIENYAGQYGCNYIVWGAGDSIEIGGVKISILAPDKSVQGQVFLGDEEVNATSLVMRFDYNESSALFVGDLYEKQENKVVAACGESLDVDLLKIPHHGKNTSSGAMLVNAVSPEIAVALGGCHMSRSIYYGYAKIGTRVYTDEVDGYVHAFTDGTEFSVITSHERNSDDYDDYDQKAAEVRGEK